jgi:hypothetical protein
MPDPGGDPRLLPLGLWMHRAVVHIPLTGLALLQQRVARAAGEVLG